MNFEQLYRSLMTVLSAAAYALLALAVVEKLANAAGYTVLQGSYAPGRLLEFAGILMLFVIALLLRQMREALRKS